MHALLLLIALFGAAHAGCDFQVTGGLGVYLMQNAPAPSPWSKTGSYIQWGGSNRNPSAGTPPNGLFTLTVRIQQAGTYRMNWLNAVAGGDDPTEGNDSYLKVAGAGAFLFAQKGSSLSAPKGVCESLGGYGCPAGGGGDGYFKVYRSGTPLTQKWSALTWDNNGHSIYIRFDQAGDFQLLIGGRSSGHRIYRMILYDENIFTSGQAEAVTAQTSCSATVPTTTRQPTTGVPTTTGTPTTVAPTNTPSPTVFNCDFEESNGIAIMEAELAPTLATTWAVRSTVAGFTGTGYIRHEGASNTAPPAQIIPYKVQFNTPGEYRMLWRHRPTGTNPNLENDAWMRMQDGGAILFSRNPTDGTDVAYPVGSGRMPNPQGGDAGANGFFKIASRTQTDWGWETYDGDLTGSPIRNVYVTIPNAGLYTIEVAGRSNNHLVDRMVFFQEATYTFAQATDVSRARTPCGGGGGATGAPTTGTPTTAAPTTAAPTTAAPTSARPTLPGATPMPTTLAPTTQAPTTPPPSTGRPTQVGATPAPTTPAPTMASSATCVGGVFSAATGECRCGTADVCTCTAGICRCDSAVKCNCQGDAQQCFGDTATTVTNLAAPVLACGTAGTCIGVAEGSTVNCELSQSCTCSQPSGTCNCGTGTCDMGSLSASATFAPVSLVLLLLALVAIGL